MTIEGYMMIICGILAIIAIVQEFYLDKRCKKFTQKNKN